MKKTIIVALAAIAILSVAAYAHMGNGNFNSPFREEHHDDMESILEEGTYQDLVDYRESTGFNVMPFVDDEESFERMQEHHEEMEQFHEENGFGPMGQGMHRGMGRGMGGGYGPGNCPMMN